MTDSLTLIQVSKLESSIRKFLERTVPRLNLVLNPIKVVIEDLPNDYAEKIHVPYDSKNSDGPGRAVTLTKEIYIDSSDFKEVDDPNFFRLLPGKTVGLQNVPFTIKANSFEKNGDGKVVLIKATKVEGGEKPRAYIHWCGANALKVTARQYNTLFNVDDPNTLDWKSTSWTESLNRNSEVIFEDALIEEGFKELTKNAVHNPSGASDDIVRFQAVRTAYFAVDVADSKDDKTVLNQIVTLKEDSSKGK